MLNRKCKKGSYVSWDKKWKKWRVRKSINGKVVYFGDFKDKKEAIKKAEEVKKIYKYQINNK